MRILVFQRPGEPRPVVARHAHITVQQVIGALSECRQRQVPIGDRLDSVAVTTQQPLQATGNTGFVVDNQDGFVRDSRHMVPFWRGGRCRTDGLNGEFDAEGSALPWWTLYRESSPVPLDYGPA